MRHRKATFKIGNTSSHNRCMIANMLKSLILHRRIETTITKAKELKKHADNIISIVKKKDQLTAIRMCKSILMIRYNPLKIKEKRKAKEGDLKAYNADRKLLNILFELKDSFLNRKGGYTRIVKLGFRVGDNAPLCYIEFVE